MILKPARSTLPDIPWEYSLGFTGHRPEKLPVNAALGGLKQALFYQIRCAVTKGFTHFLTGLADGIDYYAAVYLFHLRQKHPGIRVIGIQPCTDYLDFYQRHGYNMEHIEIALSHMDRHIILPGSSRDAGIFLRRDRFLVDNISYLIAVCREGRSGSNYTLQYARKIGIPYCRIFPEMPDGSIPPPEQWLTEQNGF